MPNLRLTVPPKSFPGTFKRRRQANAASPEDVPQKQSQAPRNETKAIL
jgi:hypothetical protein